MSEMKFEAKWQACLSGRQGIKDKNILDEFSLFVPRGVKPKTQRQINLFWYHKFFEDIISGKNYKTGLELGCGRGTMSLYLHKYNNLDVSLLDISEDAMKVAEDNFNEYGATGNFVVGSSENLQFQDNSFDVIYSIGLLEHLPDYKKTLEETYRTLAPGGVMISLNIPGKWSVQNINNWYKKFLKVFTGKSYPPEDYYRNQDKPENYLRVAKECGFKELRAVNVNPFPIFVPISIKRDKQIAKIYNFILKARKLFLKYPFKTSHTLSQGHFLIGYK